jgi:hypothetical protein
MDNSTRNNLFRILPMELITEVLALLHYRDLASCMLVRDSPAFGISTVTHSYAVL